MSRLLAKLWRSATQRVMSLVAAGMVLALLADVLIVRRFDFSAVADALIIALRLPRLIGTVGRDATKFSLMSVFITVEKEQGGEAFLDFGTRVFNLFLGIGFVLTCVGLVLAGPITMLAGWGLEPEDQALSATLLQLMSLVVLFAMGSAVLEVMLNSHKLFTVTALRNAITPGVVILAVILTWHNDRAPYWIAAAFTLGYALYFVLLLANAMVRFGFKPNIFHLPQRETFTQLRGTIAYPLAGFGVRQASRVVEYAIASLGPAGSVTAYYCAYRLLAAIQNIIGVSVALTGMPKLTEQDLAGDWKQFKRSIYQRLLLILGLTLPAAVIMMLLSSFIIDTLYGGKGKDPAGLVASAAVLFVLGPATIFYCSLPVLTSALYARKRFGAVLGNMCFAAFANVILAYVLFIWLGLTGVAWAAVATAILSMLNLLRLNAKPMSNALSHPSS